MLKEGDEIRPEDEYYIVHRQYSYKDVDTGSFTRVITKVEHRHQILPIVIIQYKVLTGTNFQVKPHGNRKSTSDPFYKQRRLCSMK